MQITIKIPEDAFSVLRTGPDEFAQELKLAAIVKWYEMGKMSQSKAAELADLTRWEFLEVLRRYQASPFQTTPDELEKEAEIG